MKYDIINLLNIVDNDIELVDQQVSTSEVHVTIQKTHRIICCPECGYTMNIKGYYTRNIKHPILTDGRKVYIHAIRKKYICSNSTCRHMTTDTYLFAMKGKHTSNLVPFLILDQFKNIHFSATDVSKLVGVSPTQVQNIFMDNFDFERLPLSEAISIDEVYLNLNDYHKYAMVVMDFITGDAIEIVNSRREEDTFAFFSHIPMEERKKVRYLICDMYKPYIKFSTRYFPNAITIVDGFHVIKALNDDLNIYINRVKKKYQELDKKRLEEKNYKTNHSYKTIKESNEVYILKHFKKYLLSSIDNINYDKPATYHFRFKQYLTESQKEALFFKLDPKFEYYRDLKEVYIQFSKDISLSVSEASNKLDWIINLYTDSNEKIFEDFAKTLQNNKQYILNSFITVEVTDRNGKKVMRRLSNGPIESFNVGPKTLRRISRGVGNYRYTRNRILLSNRRNLGLVIKNK